MAICELYSFCVSCFAVALDEEFVKASALETTLWVL